MEVKTVSEIIEEISPYYKERAEDKKKGILGDVAEATHILDHDTTSETIEAIYFFVLDLMNDFHLDVEKLVDNFTSTEGGAHFSETGMKKVRMQEEASKMLANAGVVMRSVLNITYDLKDFKILNI